MVQWESVKRVTVTEQIMEQIAHFITEGQLKAGDKLPNERELAATLGVTRGRVREALRALSLIGLITIKAGEGSFVNNQEVPIPEDTIVWMFHNEIHNLEEVYAARKLIETEIYSTAAGKLAPPHLEQLGLLLQRIRDLQEPSASAVLQLLDEFDLLIGEHCGNAIYFKLMQTIVHLRRETSTHILQVPGAVESSIESRSALLTALESGDSTKVRITANEFFKTSQAFYESLVKGELRPSRSLKDRPTT
ncbi:DNA-binding FadR family transcriptional regulator [Paenibacillus mucilaginosus]|uniref:FadR/GntR family transcriptional regulator n=1 Tax=Paenibacillus mucilaginosus TaxID=61624 RepID=UPI003D21620D